MKTILGTLITILPLIAFADAPENRISPEDAQLIFKAVESFHNGSCPSCVFPGMDWEKKEIKVQPADLALRDKWISDVLKDANGYGIWNFFKTKCALKTDPKFKVDAGVAKLWRVNTTSDPVDGVLRPIADVCGNPPNPGIQAFVQKVKVVHLQLARPWPTGGNAGFLFKFNDRTGELTVGVHNNLTNVNESALQWFRNQ